MDWNNPKIRKMMKEDIEKCDNHKVAHGSQELYQEMIVKYKTIDPNFTDALPSEAKVTTLGKPFNYCNNLEAVSQKLKLLLMINDKEDNLDPEEKRDYTNNKVFVVHGHDDNAKLKTARILEKLGLEAVILHEQPNKGKTLIEKLEEYTDVSYAIVLYTSCDLGRGKFEDTEKPRARQNVVFEHGLLIGKLSRARVCALYEDGIEAPGDMAGLVYIELDKAGSWQYELCAELKSAGFEVDSNKLI